MNRQDEAMNAAGGSGGHQSNVVNASGPANPSAANQVQAPNNAMAPGGGGQSHMVNNQVVSNCPNVAVTKVQCDLYVPCTKQVLKNSTVYLKDNLKIKLDNVRPQIYRRLLPRSVIVKSSIGKYSMGLHFCPDDLLFVSVSSNELSIYVDKTYGGVKLVLLCSPEDKNKLVSALLHWTQFVRLDLTSKDFQFKQVEPSLKYLWDLNSNDKGYYVKNRVREIKKISCNIVTIQANVHLTRDLLYEQKRWLLYQAHKLLLPTNAGGLEENCKQLYDKAYENSFALSNKFDMNANWDDPVLLQVPQGSMHGYPGEPHARLYYSLENGWNVLKAIDYTRYEMQLTYDSCTELATGQPRTYSLKSSRIHFWRIMELTGGYNTLTIFYFNQPCYLTIRWNSYAFYRDGVSKFIYWLNQLQPQIKVKEVNLDKGLVARRLESLKCNDISELFKSINHQGEGTTFQLKYHTLSNRLSKTKSASEKHDCRYRTHCAIAGDCKRLIRRAVNKLAFILVNAVAIWPMILKDDNNDANINTERQKYERRLNVYNKLVTVFQDSWYEKNAPLTFADSVKQTNRRGVSSQLTIVEYEWLYGLLEETN